MKKMKCQMTDIKFGRKRHLRCKIIAEFEIEVTGGKRLLVCRKHRGDGRLVRNLP